MYTATETHRNEDGTITSTRHEHAVGLTLADRERNYHDDSDFYAIVWNAEKQQLEEQMYATTRCAMYGKCEVDATPEVAEAAARWAVTIAFGKARVEAAEEHARALKRLREGTKVEVVRGRKVAKGTIGYVVSTRPNQYDETNERVTLQVGDERAYTYAKNVEIVEPAPLPALSDEDVVRVAYGLYYELVGRFASSYRRIVQTVWEAAVTAPQQLVEAA